MHFVYDYAWMLGVHAALAATCQQMHPCDAAAPDLTPSWQAARLLALAHMPWRGSQRTRESTSRGACNGYRRAQKMRMRTPALAASVCLLGMGLHYFHEQTKNTQRLCAPWLASTTTRGCSSLAARARPTIYGFTSRWTRTASSTGFCTPSPLAHTVDCSLLYGAMECQQQRRHGGGDARCRSAQCAAAFSTSAHCVSGTQEWPRTSIHGSDFHSHEACSRTRKYAEN